MSKQLRPAEITIISGSFVPRSTGKTNKKRQSTKYVSLKGNVDHYFSYLRLYTVLCIYFFSHKKPTEKNVHTPFQAIHFLTLRISLREEQ